MNRRKFLKVAASGSAGFAMSRAASPLFAQAAVPGVSPTEIKIGMSAAFTGASAALGTELYRGAQAWYQDVNAAGGLFGRKLNVVALDDAYDPLRCIANTLQLVTKDNVFLLSNFVGTPTLTRALPILKRHDQERLVLVGNFTGAQTQREAPYADQVFNVRSSYRQETGATVENLWKLGMRKVGVFYQVDAYGRSGADGVQRALAAHGLKIAAEATYARGTTYDADLGPAVEHLKSAGVEAVLCTGAYQACASFVRQARDGGMKMPITNVSFVGANAMLELLLAEGTKSKKDYTQGIINSQVVPSYTETRLPGVAEYRRVMEKWAPQVPAELKDPKYAPEPLGFVGLEGFLNARVITEALRRAGPDLDRAKLVAALESLGNLDLGIGTPLSFGPSRHQGLEAVFFTTVEGGKWVPLTDWKVAVRTQGAG